MPRGGLRNRLRNELGPNPSTQFDDSRIIGEAADRDDLVLHPRVWLGTTVLQTDGGRFPTNRFAGRDSKKTILTVASLAESLSDSLPDSLSDSLVLAATTNRLPAAPVLTLLSLQTLRPARRDPLSELGQDRNADESVGQSHHQLVVGLVGHQNGRGGRVDGNEVGLDLSMLDRVKEFSRRFRLGRGDPSEPKEQQRGND